MELQKMQQYRQEAELGNAKAQYDLGCALFSGRDVEEDCAEAVKWYRKAAEQGHAGAQCILGLMYDDGRGIQKDYAEAVKWLRKAAEQGLADGQYGLGLMYAGGKGVPRDEAETVKWYRMAAEQGLADGQYGLGLMYANGEGIPQSDVEAMKWYRMAAGQGYDKAQRKLWLMYDDGKGIPKNDAEIAKWYRMAAQQGNANAKFNLGLAYTKGMGVPSNAGEAVKWYRMASEQGHAKAQYYLGLAYGKGDGVPQNYAEAIRWYRMAAAQGDSEAQFNLGVAYIRGEGVPKNLAETVKWLRMASDQGHTMAKKLLKNMDEDRQLVTRGFDGGQKEPLVQEMRKVVHETTMPTPAMISEGSCERECSYERLVRELPFPSEAQIENFTTFVAGAHSWYKHLPVFPPGAEFTFYLDPNAGRSLNSRPDGTHEFCDRTDASQRFHYTWMTTKEYLGRFGHLNYHCARGTSFAVGSSASGWEVLASRITVLGGDGAWIRIPQYLMSHGTCSLTCFVHEDYLPYHFLRNPGDTMLAFAARAKDAATDPDNVRYLPLWRYFNEALALHPSRDLFWTRSGEPARKIRNFHACERPLLLGRIRDSIHGFLEASARS